MADLAIGAAAAATDAMFGTAADSVNGAVFASPHATGAGASTDTGAGVVAAGYHQLRGTVAAHVLTPAAGGSASGTAFMRQVLADLLHTLRGELRAAPGRAQQLLATLRAAAPAVEHTHDDKLYARTGDAFAEGDALPRAAGATQFLTKHWPLTYGDETRTTVGATGLATPLPSESTREWVQRLGALRLHPRAPISAADHLVAAQACAASDARGAPPPGAALCFFHGDTLLALAPLEAELVRALKPDLLPRGAHALDAGESVPVALWGCACAPAGAPAPRELCRVIGAVSALVIALRRAEFGACHQNARLLTPHPCGGGLVAFVGTESMQLLMHADSTYACALRLLGDDTRQTVHALSVAALDAALPPSDTGDDTACRVHDQMAWSAVAQGACRLLTQPYTTVCAVDAQDLMWRAQEQSWAVSAGALCHDAYIVEDLFGAGALPAIAFVPPLPTASATR